MLAGRDDSPVMTVTLRSTDTLGVLRQKVADHFKEPAESIALLKSTRHLLGSIGLDRLEKDTVTLRQAKFAPQDSVIARKKEAVIPAVTSNKLTSTSAASAPSSMNAYKSDDLVTPSDLSVGSMTNIRPLEWLCVDPYSRTRRRKRMAAGGGGGGERILQAQRQAET